MYMFAESIFTHLSVGLLTQYINSVYSISPSKLLIILKVVSSISYITHHHKHSLESQLLCNMTIFSKQQSEETKTTSVCTLTKGATVSIQQLIQNYKCMLSMWWSLSGNTQRKRLTCNHKYRQIRSYNSQHRKKVKLVT